MQIFDSVVAYAVPDLLSRGNENKKGAWLPMLTAFLAFASCNLAAVMVGIVSLCGITIAINPHVQAAAISGFAALTLLLVLWRHKACRNSGSVVLAGFGAVLVVGTMYVAFNKLVESVGLFALAAAAVWASYGGPGRNVRPYHVANELDSGEEMLIT